MRTRKHSHVYDDIAFLKCVKVCSQMFALECPQDFLVLEMRLRMETMD